MKTVHVQSLPPLSTLPDRTPITAKADGIDVVVVRNGDEIGVYQGRCPHRGAMLADGDVVGDDLICGVHGYDFRLDTGISTYDPGESIHRFRTIIDKEADGIAVEADDLAAFITRQPQQRDVEPYDRFYADTHQATDEEPYVAEIHSLPFGGQTKPAPHGPVAAMGVPRTDLPQWEHLQVLTAQLDRLPLLDEEPVETSTVIGPAAAHPLRLEIPLFVSDMSFGALSLEAKTALAKGSSAAGTAICSGEGGMLPEEQQANSRYLLEVASARFGFSDDQLDLVQAIHLKLGQGAKTGTGGHLPGSKVTGRIAEVRDLPEGVAAVSPARFPDWTGPVDAAALVDHLRERSGGKPIGVKMSAQHIERDLDAALTLGVDYVILDGRGGGTGAAPKLFRDNISVPSMAAVARARRHLDASAAINVTLIATGGLRRPADFVKAMALGADAVAVSNSALQSIGCVGMRACHTDNCPVGIATQKPHLRARLPVDQAAQRLTNFLTSSVELMSILARACGHRRLADFTSDDLTSWRRDVADLVGVDFAGVR